MYLSIYDLMYGYITFLFFFFKLEYNCFATLWSFKSIHAVVTITSDTCNLLKSYPQRNMKSNRLLLFLVLDESTKIRPTSIIISEEINRKFLFQEFQSLRIFPLGTEWWIFGGLQGRIMNICFSFHFLQFSRARSSSGFCCILVFHSYSCGHLAWFSYAL